MPTTVTDMLRRQALKLASIALSALTLGGWSLLRNKGSEPLLLSARDDADGKPRLLEINPRYSGGIGYTRETGINLPGIFATRRLGLKEPETHWLDDIRVKAITVAVRATV